MANYAKAEERARYAKHLIELLVPLFPTNTQFDSTVKDGHINIRASEPPSHSVLIRVSENAQDDDTALANGRRRNSSRTLANG